jgi:hypothetical protein
VLAALWLVLGMRLAVALWVKSLTVSACYFALAVTVVAMSMSNAAAAQFDAPRSLCLMAGDNADWHLLLGPTRHDLATLTVRGGQTRVELRERGEALSIYGTQSIIDFQTQHAPDASF